MKTFKSIDHISGMIDFITYSYESVNGDIPTETGFKYKVTEWNDSFKVVYSWYFTSKVKVSYSHETEPEVEYLETDDYFIIRKDESISKLDQYVTDVLCKIDFN